MTDKLSVQTSVQICLQRLSADNKSPLLATKVLKPFRNFDQAPLILDNRPLQLIKTIKMEAAYVVTWVKVFRIIPEFRILRLTIESQPQNAELWRL